MNNFMNSIDTC